MDGSGRPAEDVPELSLGEWFELHPLAHLVYAADEHRVLAANRAALERYGYGRDELLAMTRGQLMPPDERLAFERFIAALPASTRGPQRVWRELTKDGRPLRSQVRSVEVRWQGRLARLSAVMDAEPFAELAAQAEQQRELWRVAGAMAQVGGWAIGVPGREIVWSDEVCAIHERPRGHRPTVEEAMAHYPGDAQQAIGQAVIDCARNGRAFDVELPFVTASGRARWVRAAGTPRRDDTGRIVQVQGLLQDITERKQAELALLASRERLAATLRAVPDLWFVIDAEGRYAEVSDENDPGLIVPWSAVRGRHVAEVTPRGLRERLELAMREARRSGSPRSLEYEAETAGGRRCFEGRMVPMATGGFLYLTRDITALREAQSAAERRAAELRASQARLADLLRAIPALWFVIDEHDRYAEVSREDHADLVAPWSHARGRRIDEVLERDTALRLAGRVQECRRGGRPQQLDYTIADPAGRARHFSGELVPLGDGRVLLLAFDVTSYEQARLELLRRADEIAALHRQTEALLRAFPDPWFVFDAGNRCVEAHDPGDPRLPPAWRALRGRRLAEAAPAAFAAEAERALDAARAGRQVPVEELRLVSEDGDALDLELRAVPLAGGRVLMVLRDVTSRRRVEAALRERGIAEESARRQREFLSRMSHEMRTPLNAIMGFGQLLEVDLPAGTGRRYAGQIVDAGQRMLELVDDLLQLQRLQEPVAAGSAPLDETLRLALDAVGAAARARGIEIVAHGVEPVHVRADPRPLLQLLADLLHQVLRLSGAGSSLRIESMRSADDRACLVLRNARAQAAGDGLGAVFAPVLGAAAAPPSLGLAIVQESLHQIGGRLELQHDERAGLVAIVELPL